MMTYEGLEKENMMLYQALAKQTSKLDKIQNIMKKVNFFDISYKEMYDKLRDIYDILEV